ncbi:MAG: dNTP triphosphohydrolase [Terriglobia bacterium]|nr:dNTP triphosphohydrolase [Terriglobia bacterium]
MDWKTVLSTTRVRDHFGGGASVRSSVDLRSEFERDFGRCIYSAPFRRLQDKAQVFPLEPQDAVRTRLTHSIEVSSVARGLGADIGRWLLENKLVDPTLVSPIEVIAATCGMIHDLGNPPFGHAGEQAISEWFEKTFRPCNHLFGTSTQLAQDFLRWDGNAQTIRLITKLQVLADDFGLNLTAGTVSAACKYVAASHEVDKTKGHEYSKPGYFFSESNVVKAVREITGTGVARNPISYLVDAADDIVNATVDLEDGIKKRLITWSELDSLLRNKANGNAHFDNAVALAKEKIGTALQGLRAMKVSHKHSERMQSSNS